MKVILKLESDTIFGNGISVPGAEDISVLQDKAGFPYYKGGTFKGIFREALSLYLSWKEEKQIDKTISELLGAPGSDVVDGKLTFGDFVIPEAVKSVILEEIGDNPAMVLDSLTNLRVFTAVDDESGTVKKGSLRMARCVNQGLYFYGEINGSDEQLKQVREVLPMIKWIGTMRNRGFGKVSICAE